MDPNNPNGNPDLPPGHPFSNVQSSNVPPSFYWSATTDASSTSAAWFVDFTDGAVLTAGKSLAIFVWCVRGGQGIDGVQ